MEFEQVCGPLQTMILSFQTECIPSKWHPQRHVLWISAISLYSL